MIEITKKPMTPSDNFLAHDTVKWILENADGGFFIITAPSGMQNDLAENYKTPDTAIYDYAVNVSPYSYYVLEDFADYNPDAKFLFILNMQISLGNDNSMLLFNMSRDWLKKIKKTWFFFMTKETEYRLSTFAFDIYAHVLLKAHFSLELADENDIGRHPAVERIVDVEKSRETLERYKEKDMEVKLMSLPLDGTPDYQLLSAALILSDIAKLHKICAEYGEALKLLEYIKAIRIKILGAEHPDTVTSLNEITLINSLLSIFDKHD